MVDEAVPLFVSAVGVPPPAVVERLHAAGTTVMSMVGAPKHATGCLASGVDIICAQGTEAGAHTGDVSTMVLLPQVVDICRDRALVVGAGGIYDGRGVAACLALGAHGVWIGTKFLATPEANVSDTYKQALLAAQSTDTIRTEIFTGRPARMIKTPYVMGWERKAEEKQHLLAQGIIPRTHDGETGVAKGKNKSIPRGGTWRNAIGNQEPISEWSGVAVGQIAGAIDTIKPAQEIVHDIMGELSDTLRIMSGYRPRSRM